MLTMHQFKRLCIDTKLILLEKHGIDLSLALFTKEEASLLYCLFDFYVKVVFRKASVQIKSVTCFTDVKKLEPFLSQINIDAVTILLAYNWKMKNRVQ